MRSPKKGRPPVKSLAALGVIDCMRCEQSKSREGARPFYACWVCAECAVAVLSAAVEQPAGSEPRASHPRAR